MKLAFCLDGFDEIYEGETWKECCEECQSEIENWDKGFTKIVMETKKDIWKMY